MEKEKLQNRLILIDDWPIDETAYPEGSREKDAIFCPSNVEYDFLIPSHRYLFKRSFKRYPAQFWVEVAAYKIGCLMNVKVPPAYVAFNNKTGKVGALIEWFYGYPGHPPTRYFSGAVYMQLFIKNFDLKSGEQHNFITLKTISTALQKQGALLQHDWLEHWVKVFTFDAIIGNTDRHQENWGLIWWLKEDKLHKTSFSPAFDNGTSMGHEIIEDNFSKFDNLNYLRRYVERGTHHMKWSRSDDKKCGHVEMLLRIVENDPTKRDIILSCLNFGPDDLNLLFSELTDYNTPDPLTRNRAEFIIRLVEFRKNLILSTLK